MDKFLEKLSTQIIVMESREKDNSEFTSRVLDAKDRLLSFEQVADDDVALISRLLDDHLKMQAIIRDHHESFVKFITMNGQ